MWLSFSNERSMIIFNLKSAISLYIWKVSNNASPIFNNFLTKSFELQLVEAW